MGSLEPVSGELGAEGVVMGQAPGHEKQWRNEGEGPGPRAAPPASSAGLPLPAVWPWANDRHSGPWFPHLANGGAASSCVLGFL